MGQYANGPRIRSVNVGAIETLELDGKTYRTAFRKRPVAHRVAVGRLGLEGDAQANRKVHGGPHQALYAYPHEHYAAWETELGVSLDPPSFGENLIVDGLMESDVEIGDRLLIGSAILEVSQPRMPCSMLSVVHKRKDLTRLFGQANRPGFYLRVVQPGEVGAGDPVERGASGSGVSVLEVYHHLLGRVFDGPRVEAMLALETLGPGARTHLDRLVASRAIAGA